ncbi:LacI family transcriptional regulator [Cryobacterium lactosi]|jgi:DNA-binding LacI/PurR family transcriptional regulator|uniref:LacI family transcriptional regulator n=1 Tax=Cryobacterium lactosi TaxID=1259202 RepID=A0A4R9BLR8_9MICO|nr:LacI family DNA-binding transcriptional regulator [Cryobacterium lactosi]TFD87079.1 LacI family transcriptional regulator [Cryobacterium lactosi]
MSHTKSQRVTQRTIAELAGVSQATVSLVLNGKADSTSRIPEATRRRVLDAIAETTYVADPAARSLAGVGNDLVGIFTYEPAFPQETSDFYAPLLMGIETTAESLGVDLLMFTSAPIVDGRRQLFHEKNRLRLADGCLLLGQKMDTGELNRLVDSGYPFVAIGRRDDPAGRIPYVGVDYANATSTLAELALARGHTRFYSLHVPTDAESTRDRQSGLVRVLDEARVELTSATTDGSDLEAAWRAIRKAQPTVLIVEDATHAHRLVDIAVADGVDVPNDLSIVVLGERTRPSERGLDFTRLAAPRPQLGSNAITLLHQIMNGSSDAVEPLPHRQLLECVIIEGATLGAPRIGSNL